MSNLDNLVAKIIENGNSKADEILKQARAEADSIVAEKTNEANQKAAEINAYGKFEAARQKEQIIYGIRLEMRDKSLEAKQQLIEKVLDEVKARLKAFNLSEYTNMVKACLSKMDVKGEQQIIVPKRYASIDLASVNKTLKHASLTLYKGDRALDSGFILVDGGIENNNSVDALVDFYRDKAEDIIIKNVF